MTRLKNTYEKEIVTKLMSKLSLKNKHDVPKIKKIILNMGLGEDASDGKKLKTCIDDMALISGQKPITTKSKSPSPSMSPSSTEVGVSTEAISWPENSGGAVFGIRFDTTNGSGLGFEILLSQINLLHATNDVPVWPLKL